MLASGAPGSSSTFCANRNPDAPYLWSSEGLRELSVFADVLAESLEKHS
jgi:hypothetical protein